MSWKADFQSLRLSSDGFKYYYCTNYFNGIWQSYDASLIQVVRYPCAHIYPLGQAVLHVCSYHSIYLRVYSLHHNVLPTLQSIPLMANGPLYPITQDSSCHGQHTMPRNPWSFPWPVPHCCVLHECVCVAVAESVRSSSEAVVSGIYYSDHWWLQTYL